MAMAAAYDDDIDRRIREASLAVESLKLEARQLDEELDLRQSSGGLLVDEAVPPSHDSWDAVQHHVGHIHQLLLAEKAVEADAVDVAEPVSVAPPADRDGPYAAALEGDAAALKAAKGDARQALARAQALAAAATVEPCLTDSSAAGAQSCSVPSPPLPPAAEDDAAWHAAGNGYGRSQASPPQGYATAAVELDTTLTPEQAAIVHPPVATPPPPPQPEQSCGSLDASPWSTMPLPTSELHSPGAADAKDFSESARPARIRPVRPQRPPQAPAMSFPSDELVASMSRAERIALLERGEAPDTGRPEASAEEAPPRRNLGRELRRPPRPAPEPAPMVEQLSRRERIALLEKSDPEELVDLGLGTSRSSAARERSEGIGSARRLGDTYASTQEAGASAAHGSDGGTPRGVLPPLASSTARRGNSMSRRNEESEDQLDDDAWEQRRQNRKARLQQRTAGRPPQDDTLALVAGSADPFADAERPRRAVPGRQHERTTELPPSPARSDVDRLLDDLQAMWQADYSVEELAAVLQTLALNAHRLQERPDGLARAYEVLAQADSVSSGGAQPAELPAYQAACDAVLACAGPQLAPTSVVHALQVMAAAASADSSASTPVEHRQAHLDVLLAQLLIQLRHDANVFGHELTCDLAGALGRLHSKGLSAKRAASGANSSANKRCLEALNERIATQLETFDAGQLSRLGGPFLVAFLEEGKRRLVLQRMAELQVGLQPSTACLLLAMQAVEQAVRKHSFAFIASLPETTKDYLMRLKAGML
eukprot:TRINITY_DN19442_c0_g1_i2.p1 TRINITY_DN19442_c0_g1~~TRINITY_DN19442_c0_g1_i2.p1  ORF type:complete len:770 (+),score=160.78 TRINITY_DN19442_c0_g1_i2:54-2363(+)